jgi:dihydropteroate synthase
MLLARPVTFEAPRDLALLFARMGLPVAAREYLEEKLPQRTVLLTGMGPPEGRFLKGLHERSVAPGVELFPSFVPGDGKKRPGTGLLMGRVDQFSRLTSLLEGAPELEALLRALRRLERMSEPLVETRLGRSVFRWGERTYLMGVVNVTPDSFSDGGRFATVDSAVAHGLALVEAGADILDIGGESTRPGAAPVPIDEERRRVLPVIEALAARTEVLISVDTRHPEVAEEALLRGARLVNDITALESPVTAKLIAQAGAGVCLMHMRGVPASMQEELSYPDVVDAVLAHLAERVERALEAGIRPEAIWVDPGLGFGKSNAQNLLLLRCLAELRVLGQPVLVGPSRKAFIGHLLDGRPPQERLFGTIGAVAAVAARRCADVVRVHDVAEARDALRVVDAVTHAWEGGDLYC